MDEDNITEERTSRHIFGNRENQAYSSESIVKILILQRRDWALQSLRELYNEGAKGQIASESGLAHFAADLFALYEELRPLLKRRLPAPEYATLSQKVLSQEYDDLLAAFETINTILDDVKLTRIDTKQVFDTTSGEDENERGGM
jgi:hypothetical protein